jgi:hypothetical protein
MAKLRLGKYSNGIEKFSVDSIEKNKAILFTTTGVQFLRAKQNQTIEMPQDSPESFLDDEMQGFHYQK